MFYYIGYVETCKVVRLNKIKILFCFKQKGLDFLFPTTLKMITVHDGCSCSLQRNAPLGPIKRKKVELLRTQKHSFLQVRDNSFDPAKMNLNISQNYNV